jgi:hypothetical protein
LARAAARALTGREIKGEDAVGDRRTTGAKEEGAAATTKAEQMRGRGDGGAGILGGEVSVWSGGGGIRLGRL